MDQTYEAAATSGTNIAMFIVGLVFMLAMIAVAILLIVAMWKLFQKAGKPGWAAIVPFYNTYVMLEIARRPVWWFAVILLVPIVGTVLSLIAVVDFVKAYGKSTGYGILSLFFPFITFPIMAFDKNTRYTARAVDAPTNTTDYQHTQPAAPAEETPHSPTV